MSGFARDSNTHRWDAEDEVWKTLIQVHIYSLIYIKVFVKFYIAFIWLEYVAIELFKHYGFGALLLYVCFPATKCRILCVCVCAIYIPMLVRILPSSCMV
jgi:hypothetical protein